MIVCTALFFSGGTVAAQEAGKHVPDRPETRYNPVFFSPEKSARHITDRMDSLLNLTNKQYDKLYKLNLKWAREDAERKTGAPRMEDRPGRMPNFGGTGGFGQRPHGNRPPESIGRGPHRDFAPSNDREMLANRHKRREKKLKKVLTGEQYVRWVEERHSAMPEGRMDQ